MQEFNAPEGTWPSERGMDRMVKRAVRMMTKCETVLSKPRKAVRLLDVGCSSGALVYAFQTIGVQAEGVEPSSNPAQTAIALGLKVHQGFLEDLSLPAASYDVITLFEVIEHVKDPLKLFQECHRILFPGGVMIVKTGNTDSWTARALGGKWEYFDMTRHGGHISFFNPFSIKRLAQRCDFKIDRIQTRKVNFYEKHMLPYTLYRSSRLFANVLKHPAAWMGKGHEMLAYLQKLPENI